MFIFRDSPSNETAPFQIKVCGITRSQDVEAAIAAGIDAIGLNFYTLSPRGISIANGSRLAEQIDGRAKIVGVFVNPSVQELNETCQECKLDYIQLHGDELPELVLQQDLPPVIKAITWTEQSPEQYVDRWISASNETAIAGFLVDAFDSNHRGGTGKRARWDLLFPRPPILSKFPMILAGGITPTSVYDAIMKVRPAGIDTASGVETSPGIKDSTAMVDLVKHATRAWAALEGR